MISQFARSSSSSSISVVGVDYRDMEDGRRKARSGTDGPPLSMALRPFEP